LTQVNLEVGEKIFNDVTKMNGEIVGITETEVTINWQDGNDLVEEVMAIDELSKATLKNYITKAQIDEISNDLKYSYMKKAMPNAEKNWKSARSHGLKSLKAQDRANEIDRQRYTQDYKERAEKHWNKADYEQDKSDNHYRKYTNRLTGIKRAAAGLKEDFSIGDQFELEDDLFEITNINGDDLELINADGELFEISKKTLGNYIKANHMNNTDTEYWAGYDAGTNHNRPYASDDKDVVRKRKNRERGINRAVKRLTKEDREMNEDSMALQTLKPGSRPANDPMSIPSKLDMMKKVLTMLGNVEYNGDQVQFLNKALEYIGKEAHMIGDGDADKNKSTVACHNPSLKEDVEKLFEGQEVSEEFKEKTSNLFEAAVALRTSLLEAEIQEAYENALNEEVAELEEIFAEELSTIEENNEMYMNYVAEKWLEENKVAIESTLRNEITEQFIDGLKNLFVEHYIDIPEDKVDVLANLEEENKELSETIHALLQEKTELENAIAEATAESAFDEIVEGMNVADIEKLKTLAEHVEFDGNIDSYKDKIKFIKESHFTRGKRPVVKLDDSFIGEESVRYATPLVAATARILNEGKH
jgi:hypothetical protein